MKDLRIVPPGNLSNGTKVGPPKPEETTTNPSKKDCCSCNCHGMVLPQGECLPCCHTDSTKKYSHISHSHCWDQTQPPACGIPLGRHEQCCLCDLKPVSHGKESSEDWDITAQELEDLEDAKEQGRIEERARIVAIAERLLRDSGEYVPFQKIHYQSALTSLIEKICKESA